jgi:O-antigen/teichoic acid export membrane protein
LILARVLLKANELRASNVKDRLRVLLKDLIDYGILFSVAKFGTLLLIPIFTSYMSIDEYGMADTLLLVASALTLLFLVAQDEAFGRLLFDISSSEAPVLFWSSLANIAISSSVFALIVLIAAEKISAIIFGVVDYTYEIRLLVIIAFLNAFLSFNRSYYRWTFNKKRFFILSIGPTALILVSTFITVGVMGMGIRGALYSQIYPNLLFTVGSIFAHKPHLPSKSAITKLLKFGMPVTFSLVILSLFSVVDKSLFMRYTGIETLGYYSFGAKYAIFISVALGAFSTAWLPILNSVYKETNAKETINKTLLFYSILFSFALAVQFSLAEIAVYILAKPDYLVALNFALPLAIALVIDQFGEHAGVAVYLEKKIHLFAIAIIAGFVIFLAITPTFARLFGGVGIAYAMLIAKFTTHIIKILIAYRISPLRLELVKPYVILTLTFILTLLIVNTKGIVLTVAIRVFAVSTIAFVGYKAGILKMFKK